MKPGGAPSRSIKGKRRPLDGVSKRGTLLLHSMSHCMLFTSYHSLRFFLHPSPSTTINAVVSDGKYTENESKHVEIAHYLVSAAMSGFIAGVCEEVVNHRYAPLEFKQERGSARRQWPSIRRLPKRSLIMAGLPSALGFLALEFA